MINNNAFRVICPKMQQLQNHILSQCLNKLDAIAIICQTRSKSKIVQGIRLLLIFCFKKIHDLGAIWPINRYIAAIMLPPPSLVSFHYFQYTTPDKINMLIN